MSFTKCLSCNWTWHPSVLVHWSLWSSQNVAFQRASSPVLRPCCVSGGCRVAFKSHGKTCQPPAWLLWKQTANGNARVGLKTLLFHYCEVTDQRRVEKWEHNCAPPLQLKRGQPSCIKHLKADIHLQSWPLCRVLALWAALNRSPAGEINNTLWWISRSGCCSCFLFTLQTGTCGIFRVSAPNVCLHEKNSSSSYSVLKNWANRKLKFIYFFALTVNRPLEWWFIELLCSSYSLIKSMSSIRHSKGYSDRETHTSTCNMRASLKADYSKVLCLSLFGHYLLFLVNAEMRNKI